MQKHYLFQRGIIIVIALRTDSAMEELTEMVLCDLRVGHDIAKRPDDFETRL
jgi:hypothetical protein